ncbi:hypothetical protein H4S02_002731 [Coemansia sp. RSA 2611]|nr:hypothetical protein H4S02_002731 [Coemansia sp. RSA 2611]
MAEKPDIRHKKISAKPQLTPKEQRPTESATEVSFDAIKHTASGSLYVPAEFAASASAYALDRSMKLLALLLLNSEDNVGVKRLAISLGKSRAFLDAVLAYVGPSMLQFLTLPTALKLLDMLWAAVGSGEAMVGNVSAARLWDGMDFNRLALRLDNRAPKERMGWLHVLSTYIRP